MANRPSQVVTLISNFAGAKARQWLQSGDKARQMSFTPSSGCLSPRLETGVATAGNRLGPPKVCPEFIEGINRGSLDIRHIGIRW